MLESGDDSFLREYTSEKLSGFLRVIVSVLVSFSSNSSEASETLMTPKQVSFLSISFDQLFVSLFSF
jgi:hypothetical protein